MDNVLSETGEIKSYRGMLIEVIGRKFLTDSLFDEVNTIRDKFQDRLDDNLKFKTEVSEVETKGNYSFGSVSFKNEHGVTSVINFAITGNQV